MKMSESIETTRKSHPYYGMTESNFPEDFTEYKILEVIKHEDSKTFGNRAYTHSSYMFCKACKRIVFTHSYYGNKNKGCDICTPMEVI
jgi:hypothetical protein